MLEELTIRRELPGDFEAVYKVNTGAFGRPDEARLVELLRTTDKVLLSLVAEKDGNVVAHALFSPIEIRGLAGKTWSGASLGPVGVVPDHQRQGIGGALIRAGLDELRKQGIPFVVVLGHSNYYPRFGFEISTHFGIRCQWEVPEEAFMAMELQADGLKDVAGRAFYESEFESV